MTRKRRSAQQPAGPVVSDTAAVRQELHFVFPGNPLPAPRPRLGNGHAHHRPAYAAQQEFWQTIAVLRMVEQDALPFPADARLSVQAMFYRADHRRCDLDNLLKSALDALTGVAWTDDSQVDEIHARVVRGVREAFACTQVLVRRLNDAASPDVLRTAP